MKRLRVGVMGATGIVGQQFLRLLDEHPYFDVVALTASERSAGKFYSEATDWVVGNNIPEAIANQIVINTDAASIIRKDVDLIFSALPSKIAWKIELDLAKSGIFVFSNASAHRMDERVPILIPEVNASHLNIINSQDLNGGFIVTNSNCSTAGLVVGLAPLKKFGIQSVIVTTYQAVSGAGRRGVVSLDILGNIIPYIGGEEEKMENETKKILGELCEDRIIPANFYVNASCARVPVLNGHLESVVVDLKTEISVEEAITAFGSFVGESTTLKLPSAPLKLIKVRKELDRPQPVRDIDSQYPDEVTGMDIVVGRIRKKENHLNFFLLSHNIIRGAAGVTILDAEFAYRKNFLKNS